MASIAVLMTCYNRSETTTECLGGLFSQRLPETCSIEVFLVDDASPDGTGRIVKEKFPQVNVIFGSGGLFWCKGMRLAWDSAVAKQKYDFFLWLNDDVMLKENAIYHLLEDADKVDGVVVGTFATDATEREVSYGATRNLPNGGRPEIGTCGMSGNLVLVPYSVFEKVGPICGRYHHQYGDYDYGYQLRKKGVQYYSSSRFCGVCPQQPERYFHLKERNLFERIKLLFHPKGFSLHDAVLFKYRNWGVGREILSAGHVIYKVIMAKER